MATSPAWCKGWSCHEMHVRSLSYSVAWHSGNLSPGYSAFRQTGCSTWLFVEMYQKDKENHKSRHEIGAGDSSCGPSGLCRLLPATYELDGELQNLLVSTLLQNYCAGFIYQESHDYFAPHIFSLKSWKCHMMAWSAGHFEVGLWKIRFLHHNTHPDLFWTWYPSVGKKGVLQCLLWFSLLRLRHTEACSILIVSAWPAVFYRKSFVFYLDLTLYGIVGNEAYFISYVMWFLLLLDPHHMQCSPVSHSPAFCAFFNPSLYKQDGIAMISLETWWVGAAFGCMLTCWYISLQTYSHPTCHGGTSQCNR